jgi:methionyl-tRNA formyltransferase
MYRIIFFGASEYSIPILESLHKDKTIKIITVVTKPDKKIDRNLETKENIVAQTAKKLNLNIIKTEVFDDKFLTKYYSLKPDLGIVVAYGPPYFTKEMINFPKYKVINIHPSPLPKYRGATPAPYQIINGETKSALSFFQIDELPDHGPIIKSIPFEIDSTDTSSIFYKKAFDIASQNISSIISNYTENPDKLLPQDHSKKTYYTKLTKDMAKIDWSKPADYNERFIRAMQDWPVAWTKIKNKKNEILKMKIFSAKITNNNLSLDIVQIEGKNKISWKEIENYYKIIT